MSSVSPLGYYSKEQPLSSRRPRVLTSVAVCGIVLSVALLFLQTFAAPTPSPRGGRSIAGPEAFAVGYVLGRLVAIAFALLMLVGCCGLLALRRSARLMVLIASAGWLVLSGLAVVVMLYSLAAINASIGNSATTLILTTLLQVGLQAGFAVWAMMVVRRPGIAQLFGPDSEPTPSPILKILAALTLVYASFAVLQSLVEVVGVAGQTRDFENMHFIRMLALNSYGFSTMRYVDLLLALVLNGAFIWGCILVLAGRARGVRLVAVCCFARMVFSIGLWTWDMYAAGVVGGFRTPSALIYMYRTVTTISMHITGLMFPALLYAVFTYRRAAVEAVALPESAPPPPVSPRGAVARVPQAPVRRPISTVPRQMPPPRGERPA